MNNQSCRKKLDILRAQMDNEVASYLSHWRDLGDYIFPRRPRFAVSDVNRGDRRNQKIIDSTATLAARTTRSGMMSGITSPARPWFRLSTPDKSLSEYAPVKQWLYQVEQRISTVFLRSNLYNVLPVVYGDISVFGTGCMAMEEDFDEVVRFYPFAIGEYRIANSARLKVEVFHREFQMTVRQVVERFGLPQDGSGKPDFTNISDYIKSAWENGEKETWVDICHTIQPNEDFDPRKLSSEYKRFLSCYYEKGAAGASTSYNASDTEKLLSKKGYDIFPILAPRWEVNGNDVYGTSCPGMDALGDIKQLQIGEKRSLQAIEKMVNPPMIAPTSLLNKKTSILPGDTTYVDVRDGQQGFRPAHEVQFRIQELEMKQQQVRSRIQRAFYEDLFLMLSQSDRRDITAREIEERHEEKLLALGPVLEQLNQDVLDPLIDNTFSILARQNALPPAPDELQGMPLKVEYISIMAQAQKLVGLSGMERFAGFVTQLAQIDPQVIDKVNRDEMVDVYGDKTGVPPSVIVPDEEVVSIRSDRARAQQAQAAAENAKNASSAAKNLSETDVSGDNALTQIMDSASAGQLGGQL